MQITYKEYIGETWSSLHRKKKLRVRTGFCKEYSDLRQRK